MNSLERRRSTDDADYTDENSERSTQAGLIRLGNELGDIDGSIGKKTRDALERAGVPLGEPAGMLTGVEGLLRQKFPEEYAVSIEDDFSPSVPGHVIP